MLMGASMDAPSAVIEPLQVDVRGVGYTDVLLTRLGAGGSIDIGVVPVGKTTIAIGGGFEYVACGTVCWFFSTISDVTFSQYMLAPHGRVSWHFPTAKDLDVYALVAGGPTFAKAKLDFGDTVYRGRDDSFGIMAGMGISIFVAGPLFLGAEGRGRYARGTYSYSLERGPERGFDSTLVGGWHLIGVEALFAIGLRAPR
jgi:hypothetical protein